MFKTFWKTLKPDFVERDIGNYFAVLAKIREKEERLKSMTDHELQSLSQSLKKGASINLNFESSLIEAFALVCETAYRVLKMRPFDVQVLGALAMNEGKVIEMNTGEGKTLVATMPAYLHALSGKGVHILTFNDYLAKRDAKWMGKIYDFLGLHVGFVNGEMEQEERRKAYENDITYVTAKQAGFDYLRSFLIQDPSQQILPTAGLAIIDEVDSILIDESRTPLVIAGKDYQENPVDLYQVASVIGALKEGIDFKAVEFELNVFLTDAGTTEIEKKLDLKNLYDPENEILLYRLNQALHARCLLHKDIDYIVRNEKIELVDEFTGRVIADRKWPHGLQAAIEAKENIPIKEEGVILGKTTLQHFIKRYPKICGMTGTATPAAEEFYEVYNLPVTVIPPNKPSIRKDQEDIIFPDKASKYNALVKEIGREHRKGRPILVGTSNVEESEKLSGLLFDQGIECQVLNAKNDEEEAGIVAKAGLWGAVTISTNMAGRGTDIKLGGDEGLNKNKILELGGLYVIGTNKFESRRIDNQLRGRSGRQGDPGESRFFISLEDELLQRHGINELIPKRYLNKKEISELNSKIIIREVNRTQRIVEGKNLDIRQTLFKYASIVEIQRQIIHQQREQVLNGLSESLMRSHDPEFYGQQVELHGNKLIKRVEKQIHLAIIDKNWVEYLEESELVRQGIHMFKKAGLNPYYEYQKILNESFSDLLTKIDNEIVQVMKRITISKNGVDLKKEGLKAPSSTWTYLVSDNPFGDRLEIMLGGNIGFAAFAGIYWPLLALYFLAKRLFQKKST